ncbi:hypothetical protein KL931_001346 [Ogataea haglerorum]|nr:hypothetical protein KL931_001346 [Ogataea haglerorum]
MSYHWSTIPFASLYGAIQLNQLDIELKLAAELQFDLQNLLLKPKRSDASRLKLEQGKLTFSDGIDYQLNEKFVMDTNKLADELNLDELAAAELLYHACQNEQKSSGISALDSAKAAYYARRQYILQIVTYYLCKSAAEGPQTAFLSKLSYDTILSCYQSIEQELDDIKQLVDRSRLMGSLSDPRFFKPIIYRRDSLFGEHQLLGELYFAKVSLSGMQPTEFDKIFNHFTSFNTNDILVMSYLPGTMKQISELERYSDEEVKNIHRNLTGLTQDLHKLAENPIKAFLVLVFLTNFIQWCKSESSRTKQFDFTSSVENPIKLLISIGALEQFLSLAAEISKPELCTDPRADLMYDFRLFLQQHIPKLSPIRFLDVDADATNQLKRAIQQQRLSGNLTVDETDAEIIYIPTKVYSFESHFSDFCASVFSEFVHSFVKNAAFVLTHLRDMEEDLLLLSDSLELDVLSKNADLERFYLAVYYLYRSRPQLSAQFWEDSSSSLYGFLQWASRCNSPLIISTFCCLLSALSNSNENAINAFNFLQLTNTSTQELSLKTPGGGSTSISNRFSCVSWSSIFSSLAFYSKQLSTKLSINLSDHSYSLQQSTDTERNVIVQLGEDSLIFLSGFFQLISDIARNSDRARAELYESDNRQLISILTELLKANTPLSGSILIVISSLVGDGVNERQQVWQILDFWIFSKHSKPRQSSSVLKDVFLSSLKSPSEVIGFSTLVLKLLQPLKTQDDFFDQIEIPFPLDLGSNYRSQGIWPYVEFLSMDIFVELTNKKYAEDYTTPLQLAILSLWETCLAQLDPEMIMDASACNLKDLDNITACKNIIQYLQSHPGSAVLTFLYRMPVHSALFTIANLGIDKLNEFEPQSKESKLLLKSLNVIELILDRESFYTDELLPILTLHDNPFYNPSAISTGGLQSFVEALLLNLPLLANIALYVGVSNSEISRVALSIFKKVTLYSSSKGIAELSLGSRLLRKDKVLTMLETIDESTRIRYSFIEQIEAPIVEPQSITLKVELLQFLNQNLPSTPGAATVSHFLLGLDTRSMTIGEKNDLGCIASEKSLLKSMVTLLRSILQELKKLTDIEYFPMRISALCLEIIYKLVKSLHSPYEILDFMRDIEDSNLFVDLLTTTSKIGLETLWNGRTFDSTFNSKNLFVTQGGSMCALIAFTVYRSLILQLVALELRHASLYGSYSLTRKYVNLLIDSKSYSTGSPRLFEFLDVLEFRPKNSIERVNAAFEKFNFDHILKKITIKTAFTREDINGFAYDLSIVDRISALVGKESQSLGLLSLKGQSENLRYFKEEFVQLKKLLIASISFDSFKFNQLQCLHSWALLTQIILNDGGLERNIRVSFIFEVFESIVPQLIDYLNFDVAYAQDLTSLCICLFRLYEVDKANIQMSESDREAAALLDSTRLFPVFKTSVIGIMSPQSTPTIKADLYVLANNYLRQSAVNKSVLTEVMIFIRSADQKFIGSICNDSLTAEGSCKITALLLLETLLKISISLQGSKLKGSFLIETVLQNNYLLLQVQRIKSMDDIVLACLCDGRPRMSVDSLLYELTTFKTVFCLLTRIAQTSIGAKQLLQCDIFKAITDCSFLAEDPEIGLTLLLESTGNDGFGERKSTEIIFSLDSSLSHNDNKLEGVSLYDLYIPIFRLVCSTLISLGPQNERCIKKAKQLTVHFSKLITAILKKDLSRGKKDTKDIGETEASEDSRSRDLNEMVKLITLLDTLIT